VRESLVQISKFLSLVLRHAPERIGLALDADGWASVDELLSRAADVGRPITLAILHEVVESNDKQRFALSADGARIRARQGHSIQVDLALPAIVPPGELYHGTASADWNRFALGGFWLAGDNTCTCRRIRRRHYGSVRATASL
jgi:putative RNA 2'-phosphotransferase